MTCGSDPFPIAVMFMVLLGTQLIHFAFLMTSIRRLEKK